MIIRYGEEVLGFLVVESRPDAPDWRAAASRIAHDVALLYKRLEARNVCAAAFGRPEILLGRSAPITRLERTVELLAATDQPLVIIGEFGTQQRSVAALVHVSGRQRDGHLVHFDCGGCGESHVNDGLPRALDAAVGGTLFLESIDKMDPSAWHALSARLNDIGGLRTAGEPSAESVRLISSLRCGLGYDDGDSILPNELIARVDVLRLEVPPLRDRPQDVDAVLIHTAQQLGSETGQVFDRDAVAVLRRCSWPGNVDELMGTTARLIALKSGPLVTVEDLRRHAPDLMDLDDLGPAGMSSVDGRGYDSSSEFASRLLAGDRSAVAGLHSALQRAITFLVSHFDEEIVAAQLAQVAHLSTSHLSHLFKRELGISFKQLLNQIRIERAKALLRDDDEMRVTDIALKVGFGDLSHFLKTFRRLVGHTPREYRQLGWNDDAATGEAVSGLTSDAGSHDPSTCSEPVGLQVVTGSSRD